MSAHGTSASQINGTGTSTSTSMMGSGTTNNNNNSSSSSNERTPLLPGGSVARSSSSSLSGSESTISTKKLVKYLNEEVSKEHGDLILLICYIITGLLDSAATAIWGAFVSMQTGNTVYVGLGLAHPSSSTRWIKSLTSIASFCFGSFVFARFHRYCSPRKRWVLLTSFTLQLIMIVVSATIVVLTPTAPKGIKSRISSSSSSPEAPLHWYVLVPLALVGFQSSGQAVTSRVLSYGGLTSVVLTSIYCDLFSDAKLFTSFAENVERNRRIAAPILLLLGAVAGGLWSQSDFGIAGALWTAAVLKALIIVAWLFWKADHSVDDES